MAKKILTAHANVMKAGTMNNDHASLIRSRIINSAKELLAQEGYSKTTIRKIVEHSGVLTGSIYYFFKNKEDIFRAILLELVHGCIEKIDGRCAGESPLFRYAAVCQVELKVLADYQIVRETYRNAYASATIFEGMIAQYLAMAKCLFDDTEYELTEEEYYQNTLMIKGAMHACLSEMFFRRETSQAATREKLIRLALHLFGASEKESRDIIRRMKAKSKVFEEIGRELIEHPIVK